MTRWLILRVSRTTEAASTSSAAIRCHAAPSGRRSRRCVPTASSRPAAARAGWSSAARGVGVLVAGMDLEKESITKLPEELGVAAAAGRRGRAGPPSCWSSGPTAGSPSVTRTNTPSRSRSTSTRTPTVTCVPGRRRCSAASFRQVQRRWAGLEPFACPACPGLRKHVLASTLIGWSFRMCTCFPAGRPRSGGRAGDCRPPPGCGAIRGGAAGRGAGPGAAARAAGG